MMEPVDPALLPTLPQLHVASGVAALVLAVLTVTTILPAEYGIDPTGIGTALNLTPIGELKQKLDAPPPPATEPFKHADQVTVELVPGAGTEVKMAMRQGDQVVFTWKASEAVYFDFHGEPVGAAEEEATSHGRGTHYVKELEGFTAPFDGIHGWYWKNTTTAPVQVTVEVSGVFADLRQR